MRKWLVFIIIIIFASIPIQNCGGDGENGDTDQDNPIPTLTSISPSLKATHMPSFTLTATGTGFVTESKIFFNGTEKTTTYVSSTSLTCEIETDDLTLTSSMTFNSLRSSAMYNQNVPVMVRSPSPGGGDSSSLDFMINSNHSFYEPSVILAGSASTSRYPNIAVNNSGHLLLVWDDTRAGNRDIFSSRSADNGTTWSDAVNISNNPGNSDRSHMAVDSSGNIYVVWRDDTPGNREIYFSHSTDNGATWSTPANLSNNPGISDMCKIASDSSGNICVVWRYRDLANNNDIFFRRSTDNGNTWSTALNLTNDTGFSNNPSITFDSSNNINMVWEDWTTTININFIQSTDNGVTWSPRVNVSNTQGGSYWPFLVVDDSGNMNVAWTDSSPGRWQIYFSRSTDNGATWSPAVNISNQAGGDEGSFMAMDSAGNINVIWVGDASGNFEVYFIRSIDDATSWTEPLNISNSSGLSAGRDIALDSAGNIFVVWMDNTSGTYQIYFTGNER